MEKEKVQRIWQVLLEIRAMEQGEPANYDVDVKEVGADGSRLVRAKGAAGN